jgi:hypothetical protein
MCNLTLPLSGRRVPTAAFEKNNTYIFSYDPQKLHRLQRPCWARTAQLTLMKRGLFRFVQPLATIFLE